MLRLGDDNTVFAEESFRQIGDTEILILQRGENNKTNSENIDNSNSNVTHENNVVYNINHFPRYVCISISASKRICNYDFH